MRKMDEWGEARRSKERRRRHRMSVIPSKKKKRARTHVAFGKGGSASAFHAALGKQHAKFTELCAVESHLPLSGAKAGERERKSKNECVKWNRETLLLPPQNVFSLFLSRFLEPQESAF